MSPTETLMTEHKAVLLALELLSLVGSAVAQGKPESDKDLEQLLDFFRGFVDRCHHGKEEQFLFPELQRFGIPKEGGPIGVMLSEHEMGRGYVKRLKDLLIALRQGDKIARGQVPIEVNDYRQVLESHIQKENQVLFPLADRLLPKDRAEELVRGFDRIEREQVGEDKHEAYHQMLQELKQRYGI
jgi:hemerythrin-like domain-containing protein